MQSLSNMESHACWNALNFKSYTSGKMECGIPIRVRKSAKSTILGAFPQLPASQAQHIYSFDTNTVDDNITYESLTEQKGVPTCQEQNFTSF